MTLVTFDEVSPQTDFTFKCKSYYKENFGTHNACQPFWIVSKRKIGYTMCKFRGDELCKINDRN